MEGLSNQSNKVESDVSTESIEESANFEGNWSEVLFSRMQNPVIRGQIVDLLSREDSAYQDYLQNEVFTFDFVQDNGNRILRDSNGKQIAEIELEEKKQTFKLRSREEIESEFNERLAEIMSFTSVSFSSKTQPSSERMTLNWNEPYSNKPLTVHQMSITEAHEKGHVLRPYHSNYYPLPDIFTDHFLPAFDIEQVKITTEDMRAHAQERSVTQSENPMPSDIESFDSTELTEDRMREEYVKEYLFSAPEIAERMAQLKNYFGMSGADIFTKEHLTYAREHYIDDTGLNNGMTHFFQAITPQTEGAFLELINTSGI